MIALIPRLQKAILLGGGGRGGHELRVKSNQPLANMYMENKKKKEEKKTISKEPAPALLLPSSFKTFPD